MSKKKGSAPFFENPVYHAIEFEPFKEMPSIPKKIPSDAEVNAKFADMVSDLDVRQERRVWFSHRPIAQKWELYCEQVKEDADSPSPDYLLKCLNLRPGGEVLACLAKFISKGRISWLQRFMDLKGHQYLLSILNQHLKSFTPECFDDLSRDEVIAGTLYCLRNIVNTKMGSKAIVNYSDAIPIVVSSMSSKVPQTFEHSLTIMLLFLFSDNPSVDNIANIKSTFSSIRELKDGWACFANELHSRPDRQFIVALSTFVKGLLVFLSSRHQMRLHLSLSIVESGLFNAFKELKYESSDPAGETVSVIISRVTDDMKFLSTIFKEPTANPFSTKSLCKAIKYSIEPPMLFHSILLSLLDITINYKVVSSKLFVFLHNFLILFRYYLAQKDSSKMNYSISVASNLKNTIKIPFSSTTFQSQPVHEELCSSTSFICDSELAALNLAEFMDKGIGLTEAAASGGEDSKVITSLQANQEKEELRKQCEEKVQSLQSQLDAVKATVRMALESKEKEIAKSEELKSALEKAKKESEEINKKAREDIESAKKEAESAKKEGESMKKEAEASKIEKENAKNQAENVNNELESLKREMESLKASNEESGKTSGEKEKKYIEEKKALTERAKKAEAMLEKSEKDNKEKDAKIYELQASEDDIRKAEAEQKAKNIELQKELSEVKSQLSDTNSQLSDVKSQLEAEMQKRKESEELQKSQLETLKKQISVSGEMNQKNMNESADKLRKSDSQIQTLQNKLQNTEAKVQSSEKAIREKDSQLEEARKHNAQDMESSKKTIMQLNDQIEILKSSSSEKESRIKSLQSSIAEMTEREKVMEAKDSSLAEASHGAEEARRQLNEAKAENDRLHGEIQDYKSQIEMLKRNISTEEAKSQAIAEDLKKSGEVVKENEAKIEEYSNEINDLRNLNSELSSKNSVLETQLSSQNTSTQQITESLLRVSELESSEKSLKESNSSKDNEIEKLKKRINEEKTKNDAEIENIKKNAEELKTSVEAVKSEKSSIESNLKAKEKELNSQTEEYKLKQNELTSVIEALSVQTTDLSDKIASLDTKNADMVTQIKTLKSEKEILEKKLKEDAETYEKKQKDEAESAQKELGLARDAAKRLEEKVADLEAEKENIIRIQKEQEIKRESEQPKEVHNPTSLPQKPNPTPQCPLQQFFWKPINNTIANGSFWQTIPEESPYVSREEIISLFTAPSTASYVEVSKAKAIAIFLSQIKKPVSDIAKGLLQMDDWLSEENLIALKAILPTEEELKPIQTFNGNLSEPDSFLKAIASVPSIQLRVETMILSKSFKSKCFQFASQLSLCEEGLKEMKASKKLQEVLSMIAFIGNVLNGGTQRGGAYGFSLDSLSKLKEVGGKNVSLLSYISRLIKEKPQMCGFGDEIRKLISCENINICEIHDWITKAEETVQASMIEMANAESRVPDGDLFFPKFMGFYEEMRTPFEEAKGRAAGVEESFNEVKRIFAIADLNLNQVVEAIKEFEASVNEAIATEKKSEVVEVKAVEKKEDTERGVIDSLMQNIQTNNTFFGGKKDEKAKAKKSESSFFSLFRK